MIPPEVNSLTWNRKRKRTHSRGAKRVTDEIGYVLAALQDLTDRVKTRLFELQYPGDLKGVPGGKPTRR